MAVDWSQLPKELLQFISEKLNNNELYLIRFRSVCSTWRSSILKNPQNHLPYKIPQFSNPALFLSDSHLLKHNLYIIKPPTTDHRPWLIRIGRDLNGKTQLRHPLYLHQPLPNPPMIDFNELAVFDLGDVYYIYPHSHIDHQKVVAVTSEGKQPQIIVTFNHLREPMMFHCEDKRWTMIPYVPWYFLKDIYVFKGQSYVVDKDGRTMVIELDSSLNLVAEPVFGGESKFLVESECELLLVDIHKKENEDSDENRHLNRVIVWIDVFRLDEKEKKWVKLTSLGDRVLFLGDGCSFSASASDLCVENGNCVIVSTGFAALGFDNIQQGMHVFHLDQGRVSHLSDYPDYFGLFWPPPSWIEHIYS